jgi:hypothetical protein
VGDRRAMVAHDFFRPQTVRGLELFGAFPLVFPMGEHPAVGPERGFNPFVSVYSAGGHIADGVTLWSQACKDFANLAENESHAAFSVAAWLMSSLGRNLEVGPRRRRRKRMRSSWIAVHDITDTSSSAHSHFFLALCAL